MKNIPYKIENVLAVFLNGTFTVFPVQLEKNVNRCHVSLNQISLLTKVTVRMKILASENGSYQ